MEKIKKVVKKEETEVVAVQITKKEFIDIAAKECTEMFLGLASTGEPSEMDVLLPMVCSKYAAHLAARIFDDKNDESEENKNA
jgi:hypothetical protein